MLMCHIFPFGEVEKNEEIIIWGMGYVGKQYVEEILYTKYCKVLFAVDQKYNEIHFPYVDIKRPETIKEYPNIKIVIAQQNILIANEIKNKLLKWEIVDKKIVHNSKFITLEDSLSNRINQVSNSINQVSNDLNQVWDVVKSINQLKNIFVSIESDIRDGRNNQYNKYSKQEIIHYKRIHNLMEVKSVIGFSSIRIGNMHDGGYMLIDTFGNSENPLVAYSFGISNDISWDKHMSLFGYDIFMYDHTIESLPEDNNKFHFYKIGISGNEQESGTNLMSLEQLIKINNHSDLKGMILKMDVEGAEYGFLNTVESKTLEQFEQIVLELHFITKIDMTDMIINALQKLNRTHQLVHIHANNFSRIRYINGNAVPDSIEVLYVLKNNYQFEKVNEIKDDMDKACWEERLEISLKNWNQYKF